MRRTVASNLLWMLADRGVQVCAGILVISMLARALGTEGFGHFQYAQSLVYIAASIPLLCPGEVVVPRLVALEHANARHALIVHAFVMRFGAGLLGYALVCALLFLTHQPADIWMPAAILGIAITLREPFGIVTAWMQSRTHNRPSVIISLIALGAKVLFIAALFFTGVTLLPAYASAFALEAIIAAALLAWYYLSGAPRIEVPLSAPLTRELMRDGSLFWISFMLMVAARRADQLILKPLVPVADLGAYSATMQVLDNYTMLAAILTAGVAPIYVYAQRTAALARRNIVRIGCAMTAVGLFGAIALMICAPWIVYLLYGAAFGATIDLLRMAALAATLVFTDAALSLLLIYLRKPKWVAFKWALVLVTTVIVDVVAVPRLGTMGAVLGYTLANAVAVVFGIVQLLRSRTIQEAAEKSAKSENAETMPQ